MQDTRNMIAEMISLLEGLDLTAETDLSRFREGLELIDPKEVIGRDYCLGPDMVKKCPRMEIGAENNRCRPARRN
jgi:hypothetical protein